MHVHCACLYISLPSLHDHDVKCPEFTLYGGRTEAQTKLSLSQNLNWIWFVGIQLGRKVRLHLTK